MIFITFFLKPICYNKKTTRQRLMKMKTRISRILGGKVLTAAVAGFIILSLIFIVLLSIETRGNRKALVFLISWSP